MKILLFFCTLLYVLGPILKTPLGIYADPILFVSTFLCLLGLVTKFSKDEKPRLFVGLFESSFFLFQFYLLFPLYWCYFFPEYGTDCASEMIKPIRILLTLYGGLVLVLFYRKVYGEFFYYYILKHIVFILFVNSVVMIFQTLNPGFRDYIENSMFRIDDGINRYGLKLRSSGLYLSGGALPSAFQAMVTIFIPLLVKKNIVNIYVGLFIAFVLFTTSILTGRTGLFALFPYFIISFYLFSKVQLAKMLFVFVGLFVTIIFVVSLSLFEESSAFMFVFDRFSMLEGYVNNKAVDSDPTFDALLGKWSIPNNIVLLLFGTLGFSNIVYTHVSDMGFNISLWKYGLIGSFIFYSPFFKLFCAVKKTKEMLYYDERLTTIIFVLTYLMFEFKENMMYARNGLSILSLAVWGYIVYRNMMIYSNNRLITV